MYNYYINLSVDFIHWFIIAHFSVEKKNEKMTNEKIKFKETTFFHVIHFST